MDYLGVCTDGRVVLKQPVGEIDNISVPKALLRRVGALAVRTDMLDVRIYCFSRWIINLVIRNTRLTSLRMELLPFLVHRQFQPLEFMEEHFPEIQYREVRYECSHVVF